jgi:hypothetical protein
MHATIIAKHPVKEDSEHRSFGPALLSQPMGSFAEGILRRDGMFRSPSTPTDVEAFGVEKTATDRKRHETGEMDSICMRDLTNVYTSISLLDM